ncbi:MAG: nitrogen fixation protein NifZ [Oculatellaceae cyanobacterium Prado106]|jgi:nitrogen fixation protein NifZ|nr:nitrogen fixation protein NifZ [Oculatellaceae cyanobacterium Prado106]
MQSDDTVEVNYPPIFDMGQKVRSRKLLRNDGTFPGRDIGVTLAKKGDVGYVVSIGTYLQTYYIYAVHFIERGAVVGCRSKELELADAPQPVEQDSQESELTDAPQFVEQS